MTFDSIVEHVLERSQCRGRMPYRTLKRQFNRALAAARRHKAESQ